jgi:hypothetical protein
LRSAGLHWWSVIAAYLQKEGMWRLPCDSRPVRPLPPKLVSVSSSRIMRSCVKCVMKFY